MPLTTIEQTEEIPASPLEVYEALVDGEKHAAFTGSPATSDPRIGGHMTAHDDYIRGEYLELEPGARILQSWRTSEWPDGYDDSKLEIRLEPIESGTRLTMVHSLVPVKKAPGYDAGWKDHYWEPLIAYFADR